MPTYTIKAPDGNTYSIDGPDGATDEQVRSRVMAQHPGAANKPTAAPPRDYATEGEGFLTNMAAGAGKSVTDLWLGARQAANTLTGGAIGDKAELEREAAEKEKLDAALMRTGGGNVGKYGTDVLTSLMPMGGATKAVSLIPKVTGTGILRALAPTAAVGAAQSALEPSTDYSLTGSLEKGGAAGVAADFIGRGAGRVLKPMQALIPQAVKEQIALLPDKATLLAENLSASPGVKMLTNALAQIPGIGSNIVRAREGNLAEGTKLITGAAGMEMPAITPSGAAALHDRVAGQAANFRSGPDLPVPGMPAALDEAKSATQLESLLLGTRKPAAQLESAQRAVQPTIPGAQQPAGIMQTIGQAARDQPGAPLANTIEAAGAATPGYGQLGVRLPGAPPATPTVPAATAMNVRRELGDQAYRNDYGISTRGAEAIKSELENALRARHGNDFDRWLAEHGASLDVRKLQNAPGAITPAGHVRPEAMVNLLPEAEVARPTTPFAATLGAMGQRMSSPSLSENRSLAVRLLMGSPMLAGAGILGGAAGYGSDSPVVGAGTAATSLALASQLLGTAGGGRYLTGQNRSAIGKLLQSDKTKELARLLATTGINDITAP